MKLEPAPLPHHAPWWRDARAWAALALVAIVAAAGHLVVRNVTGGMILDEKWIIVPITDLIEQGWSVRTAIDFTETKGPGLIWPYAIFGELVGGSLHELRLLSAACFALAGLPMVILARRCGATGAGLLAIAWLMVVMPYHAVMGQLLMSEPSFVLGTLAMLAVFVGCVGATEGRRRWLGPLVVGVLLSILLHSRVHAVATAGALCLVALEREGARSWPWWLACLLAGLSRIPLWIRWGGLVSPEYQSMHGLGMGLDGSAYLLAALLPWTAVFVGPLLTDRRWRERLAVPVVGAVLGTFLLALATPDLGERMTFGEKTPLRYLGMTATIARMAGPDGSFLPRLALIAFGAVGGASLGVLAVRSWRRPIGDPLGVVGRLSVWTFLAGIGLYALTDAFVFDRYLLPWGCLLPILWWRELPRGWAIAQAVVLTAMAGWLAMQWLG